MKPDGVQERGFSIKRLKTFESFRVPAYRVYFISMIGQWAVMGMQMMVRSWLVFRITDSSASIGIIALAQAIPTLIMSFFGGAIADKIQKNTSCSSGVFPWRCPR